MDELFDNIPVEILDWLSVYKYGELSADKKQLVDQYFSADEYEAFRESLQHISNISHYPDLSNDTSKQQLLDKFDRVHPQQKEAVRSYTTTWRAAAVLLFVIASALATIVLTRKADIRYVTVSRPSDTVVITKLIPVKSTPAKRGPAEIVNTVPEIINTRPRKSVSPRAPVADKAMVDNLTVVTMDKYDEPINNNKHNSIGSDSLIQQFRFVSL